MHLIRLSLLLLVTALAAAQAQAQTVNLYCSKPNQLNYAIEVDYAARTVVYKLDYLDSRPTQASARITDTQIVWEQPGAQQTLNRATGELNTCDKAGCVQRACKPLQRQF